MTDTGHRMQDIGRATEPGDGGDDGTTSMSEQIRMVNPNDGAGGTGILLIKLSGKLAFANPQALTLMAQVRSGRQIVTSGASPDGLPGELADWLSSVMRRLRDTVASHGTLFLEERVMRRIRVRGFGLPASSGGKPACLLVLLNELGHTKNAVKTPTDGSASSEGSAEKPAAQDPSHRDLGE